MPLKKSDKPRSKEELLKELAKTRKQVSSLEKREKKYKQQLEALKESEKQHRTILESQGEGVAMVDPNERFIFANPAAERIFGVKTNELIKHNLKEFVEPEEFESVIQQTEKRRKGLQSVYELEIIRPDKEKRTIFLTVAPFYDEQKQFKGALAIFRDITQQKRAEETLKEEEDILRAVVESSSDGILVVDVLGNTTHTNKRFYEMWHIPGELKHSQDHMKLLYYVLEQLEEPQVFLSKVLHLYQSPENSFDTLLFKDGRMFERVSFPLMRKGKIAGRVWAFRDITQRKRIEEEKQRLEKQLQHAQKMEAVGTLAGGIAHDFNNILAAIIGYTELAGDDVPEDSLTNRNLNQILIAANRAKELVKQILTFSRKEEEKRKPVFLGEIIRESLKLLRASLPATIEIRSSPEEPEYPILADPIQVHQVIMNLCTNAAYAMREKGGILEVSLKEIELGPGDIPSKGLPAGRYHQLSISDTGQGIPQNIINRIFEPYFTTKEHGEGSGMGLAVVYGILKNHGGNITVYSEPGTGTTFHVYFKITTEKEEPGDDISQLDQLSGGNETILWVDDEENLIEVGKRILTGLGYQVESTTSSTEALEIFRANPSKYDLVVSDQTMPHLTGIQLTGKLKKIRPDIQVILCTGFSESINEKNFKSKGVDAFLMKPVERKRIAYVIRQVLDKKIDSQSTA